MKSIKKAVFVANDGREFFTEEEALQHEARLLAKQPETVVAGKSVVDLLAAVNGSDPTLADAIEALARAVVKRRIANGEFKRPRGETAVETATDEPANESEAA